MNKSYRVGIQATDGYSKPFAKASQANVEFEKSVSAARAEVNKLGKTQRDVANYQSTKTNLSNSNKEIENLRNSLRLRERLLTSHKTQLQKHQSDVSREKAKLRRLEKRGASDAEINKQKVNLTEITNKLAGLRKERDKSTVSIKSEKKKLERLTAAQEKHTNRLKALEGEIERAGFSTKKLGNAEETLARKTAKATRKMELQKKQLKELRKLEDRLANAQDKRGKAMAQAAKGAGILYGMSGTLDKSGDFQDAMVDFAKKAKFKTTFGVELSEEQQEKKFEKIGVDILANSGNVGMTPVQMAEIIASGAGANVARDGFESEDLKRFSTLAAKMSIAFDELEPKEAGKSVAAWKAALGLDLERLEKMAGAINHFSDNSAANTGALTKLMTRQGAVIKAAGFNEIQATALGAAVLAANGNQAEMGATAAKNFALNMTLGDASSGEQKLAYKRLGFDPASISKQMNTDAVGTVHKVFERINQQPEHNRPAIVKQLFGKESIGGIMPLINNIDELRRVMSIANDKAAIAGSLDREFDKQRNTYSFGKTQLQSGFDAFTIAVGDELMPSATIIVNGLADMLKGGASFIKENKELAGAIIRASAAAAVIGTGVAVLRAGSFAMQTVFLKRNIAETKMGASLSATSRLSQWATTRLAAFAASIRATGAAATAGGVGGGYGGAGVDVDLDGDDKKSSRRRSRRPRKGFKGIWDRAKNSGGKVVKRLPVVGLAAGAGTLAYAAADENTSGRDMAEMAGSLGGAAAGAAIGSIIPGIGTIVGAIVGGIAGEGLGRLAGGSLFDWFTDEDDKKEPGEAKKQVAEAKAAAAKTETKIREVNVDLLNSKLGIENQIAHQLSRSNAAGIKPHSQLEIAKTTEYKLEFSPVITIHGDADKSVIDSALQRSEERVTEQIMQLGRKPRLKDQVATNFSDGHLVGFD